MKEDTSSVRGALRRHSSKRLLFSTPPAARGSDLQLSDSPIVIATFLWPFLRAQGHSADPDIRMAREKSPAGGRIRERSPDKAYVLVHLPGRVCRPCARVSCPEARLTFRVGVEEVHVGRGGAGTQAADGDPRRVAPEASDVLAHPAEGERLVHQPQVARQHLVLRRQEPC